MKINWSIIGGFGLGSFAGVLGMKACEFLPVNTHQGWACIVLYIFTCIVAAALSMEES